MSNVEETRYADVASWELSDSLWARIEPLLPHGRASRLSSCARRLRDIAGSSRCRTAGTQRPDHFDLLVGYWLISRMALFSKPMLPALFSSKATRAAAKSPLT